MFGGKVTSNGFHKVFLKVPVIYAFSLTNGSRQFGQFRHGCVDKDKVIFDTEVTIQMDIITVFKICLMFITTGETHR